MEKQLRFRIVLASEAEAFLQERAQLKEFVKSLNEPERRVCYELVTEEILDREDDAGQSFYLLVGQELPEDEKLVFQKVYDRFCKTGTPAMYTWFRRKPGDPVSAGVKAFMTQLDEEIGHFFSLYEEIDSVKLAILLELARNSGQEDAFALQDGAAFLNGKRVLPLDNIPLYKENAKLQELLKQQKQLAAEFEAAAVALAHDPENRTLAAQKEEISRCQRDLFEILHRQEKDLRDLLLEIDGLKRCGPADGAGEAGGICRITPAQKLAVRELESGHYENGTRILRRADRSAVLAAAGRQLQADKKVLAGYVSENRLLIKTLLASGVTEDRADEIGRCWEESLRLTREYGLDPLQVKEYLFFLTKSGEYEKALTVSETLEKLYLIRQVPVEHVARLAGEKGQILDLSGRPAQAEKALLQSVKWFRELALAGGEKYFPDLLLACHNMGTFESCHFGKQDQAQRYLDEAEEGYEKLCREDPRRWEMYLVPVLVSEASLLRARARGANRGAPLRAAEQKYKRALDISRRYAREDVMGAGEQLAVICKNLAALYAQTRRPDQSPELLREAAEVMEQMAERSPVLYGEACRSVQEMYLMARFSGERSRREENRTRIRRIRELNLGTKKLQKKSDYKKKKYLFEKALPLCAWLEEEGVLAVEAADLYHNYSLVLSGERAKAYLRKSWDIYAALARRYPAYCLECFQKDLRRLRDSKKREMEPEEMAGYADRALSVCEGLAGERQEELVDEILAIYEACAGIYHQAGRLSEAEELFAGVVRQLKEQQEETADPEEAAKIRGHLEITEDNLRNLYLSQTDLDLIRAGYSEKEIDGMMGKILEGLGTHPGAFMMRKYAEKVVKAGGREKYFLAWQIFRRLADIEAKKDQAAAEQFYQIGLVLLRQLNEMEAGLYGKEAAQMEEKIRAHHARWK